MSTAADIILICSNDDRPRVGELLEALHGANLHADWGCDTRANEEWDDEIVQKIEAAAAVVVVWTTKLCEKWATSLAERGAEYARRREKLIVEVTLDDDCTTQIKWLHSAHKYKLGAWEGTTKEQRTHDQEFKTFIEHLIQIIEGSYHVMLERTVETDFSTWFRLGNTAYLAEFLGKVRHNRISILLSEEHTEEAVLDQFRNPLPEDVTGIDYITIEPDPAEIAGWWLGAISLAITWIWAPALFVSVQQAYQQGIPGIFWFTFPNILSLMIIAPLAIRIRELLPNGYSQPEWIRLRFDKKTHKMYLVPFFWYQLMAITVQLYAGGSIFSGSSTFQVD